MLLKSRNCRCKSEPLNLVKGKRERGGGGYGGGGEGNGKDRFLIEMPIRNRAVISQANRLN